MESIAHHAFSPVLYVPTRHATTTTAINLSLPRYTHHYRTNHTDAAAPTTMAAATFGPQQRSAFKAVSPRSKCQWIGDSVAAAQRRCHRGDYHSIVPKSAPIRQSYSKLFARNELLKWLVAKQLKVMGRSLNTTDESAVDRRQLQPEDLSRYSSRTHSPTSSASSSSSPSSCTSPGPASSTTMPPSSSSRLYTVDITSSNAHSASDWQTLASPIVNSSADRTTASTCNQSQRLLELSSVIKSINSTKAVTSTTTALPGAVIESHGRVKVTDRSHLCLDMAAAMSAHHRPEQQQQQQQQSLATRLVFRCDWKDCNRTFATAEQWTIHVTHTHVIADADDGLYYCQWKDCPRAPNGFNARYKMLIHVRSHTNDKPYRCPHCAKTFLRSETLRIHKRIHSSEKLFACKFLGCSKRYTDPSSLRKHVKTKAHIVIEV